MSISSSTSRRRLWRSSHAVPSGPSGTTPSPPHDGSRSRLSTPVAVEESGASATISASLRSARTCATVSARCTARCWKPGGKARASRLTSAAQRVSRSAVRSQKRRCRRSAGARRHAGCDSDSAARRPTESGPRVPPSPTLPSATRASRSRTPARSRSPAGAPSAWPSTTATVHLDARRPSCPMPLPRSKLWHQSALEALREAEAELPRRCLLAASAASAAPAASASAFFLM
mmetsp:Transcript_43401/g.109898  ORF Transcript_43401/g.109898 Transcript_43401/m.109898 type:complete len:232 (-) Transcript_43401:661-1356(-)